MSSVGKFGSAAAPSATSNIRGLSAIAKKILSTLEECGADSKDVIEVSAYHYVGGSSDKVYFAVCYNNTQNMFNVNTYWGRNGGSSLQWNTPIKGRTNTNTCMEEVHEQRMKKGYTEDQVAAADLKKLVGGAGKASSKGAKTPDPLDKIYEGAESKNALLL